MVIDGNEAIGLGAAASGCKFYSAYPMTPSTGIMVSLAKKACDFGIIVEQAEDEIAAINMAIGASGREIFKGFMTEALLLTLLGGTVGMVSGVVFSWAITFSLEVPLYMRFSSFLWAFLMAVAFGFLFALYPAFKASRLSPMEALRYE